MPKGKASYKCLSMIMLDFVVKVKKNYYTQALLEECKYEIKETKMENLIDDELEASLSDDDETESDNKKHNDKPDE